VLSLTAFHDWIDDVQDLLLLEGAIEVPGNIGSGRRRRARGELTAPLDSLELAGGRVDASGRWQRSRVTDPLTASVRGLSDEAGWQASLSFRQDLERVGLAWSLTAFAFDDRPQFGLDELDVRGQRFDIDGFVERRFDGGLRLKLGVKNLRHVGEARRRVVFAGPRDAAAVRFVEVRQEVFAREIFVELAGTLL